MATKKTSPKTSPEHKQKRPKVIVAGLLRRGDTYLLVKERLENDQDMWIVPGGKVEFGESLEEAVRREMFEELGIEVRIERLIAHHEAIHVKYDYHTIIFFYELTSDHEPKASIEEVKEVRFMSLEEMVNEPLVYSARWLLENHLHPQGELQFSEKRNDV